MGASAPGLGTRERANEGQDEAVYLSISSGGGMGLLSCPRYRQNGVLYVGDLDVLQGRPGSSVWTEGSFSPKCAASPREKTPEAEKSASSQEVGTE